MLYVFLIQILILQYLSDWWICFYCWLISASLRDPDNPEVLIEGVLFRARYLGSTQLISEGQPSKAMRMMQAQEAVGRIKVRKTTLVNKWIGSHSFDRVALITCIHIKAQIFGLYKRVWYFCKNCLLTF